MEVWQTSNLRRLRLGKSALFHRATITKIPGMHKNTLHEYTGIHVNYCRKQETELVWYGTIFVVGQLVMVALWNRADHYIFML